ncbi:alpha/beta-hydrolase [Acephala macrosclerotiorum]|nr:alpha/beta-hydrolase [Acephala macrosclerotiorum]
MPFRRHQHSECTSAGRVTAQLLLSFLALSTPTVASHAARQQAVLPIVGPFLPQPQLPSARNNEHVFTLRHVFHHGDLNRPAKHLRIDVPKDVPAVWMEQDDAKLEEVERPLVARGSSMNIHRLKDRRPSVVDPRVAAARSYSQVWESSADDWTTDDVNGPDITDVGTVLTFAHMAANAYVETPNTGDWADPEGGFNRTDDNGFGWEGDGLRGYLYADETNSTIVIGVKGTSLAIWDGDGTTTNDKENDNLFFSCCCGQQGSTFYRQVCDCATGTYTCNLTCLKKSLTKENRYYAAARYLYQNVTAMYPESQVWLTGHSLGGAVSALIGLTYGVPAVTFQAVPDALPANRLGLPVPPGIDPDRPGQREYTGGFHFGQNADPIYMGTCNGATATCSYAGYALESACHSGRECIYDVVNANGTRVSIITHKILWVIENVIKKWTVAPACKFTPECYDCPLWKEVTGNSSKTATTPISTSSKTKTRTRTETCQTPGWWGCLDETTTTGATTTSPVTTTSTSTCKTPGWFGCNDEKTTTSSKSSLPTATKTSTSTTSTSTSTCKTPGWFGCNDPTTSTSSSPSPSPTCETPGRSHAITSPPAFPTPTSSPPGDVDESHCVRRSWFGWCKEWSLGSELKEEI